jgi:hypothetical protein
MLPEDAMRRESRSVPPHLFGTRHQASSGLAEGECAATAAAQLLFADRGISGVGSGTPFPSAALLLLLFGEIEEHTCKHTT